MNELQATENELEPIAIVSMACRFPKADDIEEFWQLLKQSEEGISFFTDEELIAAGVDQAQLAQAGYVKAKGMIEGIEDFDAHLFGYTPREVELMDPQQRILLECAWQLLERAALDPDHYSGEIAAFAGVGMNIYLLNNLLAHQSLKESSDFYQMLIGSDKDFAATRLAYKMNLKGSAVAINTACSTSLVAVHYACQSLWDYQCDAALAGGATLLVPQKSGYLYQPGGIPSDDGHCRAFDAQANGTVPASGAGLVLLKRLEDAIEDKDTIYAVIKGSAVNNDGADKIGFTAPSVNGQAAVIAEAMAIANVKPESIDFVEAHGTATPMGDPVEIAALKLAFVEDHKQQHCALGSVKTNLGHMDTAAGIAGLMKAALALYHQKIPASLHFSKANPDIDFKHSPFYVNQQLQDWPQTESPRRASVSSFGIGGTNAHVVLEQAPDKVDSIASTRTQILALSAKSPEALQQLVNSLANHLENHPQSNLADVAYSLAIGRRELEYRAFVVANTSQQAIQYLTNLTHPGSANKSSAVVFMFPGQGSQKIRMGQALYDSERVFKQHLDLCCDYLIPILGQDLRKLIFPPIDDEQQAEQLLNQTQNTQPALFAVEYALAQQLMAWGIKPDAMIGHSLGEYVAACLSGVFSLEQALTLVAQRARFMQEAPSGSMLAVMAAETQCQQWLNDELALAAVNTDQQCVLSGSQKAIDDLIIKLKQNGIAYKQLQVSHGFHSPLMQVAADNLIKQFSSLKMKVSSIPYLSNVTGYWVDSSALSVNYFAQHMLQPVRFSQGLETLTAEFEQLILLEVGAGKTLQTLAKPVLRKGQQSFAMLGETDNPIQSLAEVWSVGVSLDWESYYHAESRQRIVLPTYPFQRQRCWIEPITINSNDQIANKSDYDLSHWFSTVNWQRHLIQAKKETETADYYFVFINDDYKKLQLGNGPWRQVVVADSYQQMNQHLFGLNPEQEADFESLFSHLDLLDQKSIKLVYCWENIEDYYLQPYIGLLNFCKVLNRLTEQCRCRITVITRDLFEVTGAEVKLSPLQSLLLGPVKVIPEEYPQIQCRLLDLSGEYEILPDLQNLGYDDAILAWRHGYYWHPVLQALNIPETSTERDVLKHQACYLITGGLGGVGLSLAGFLARKYQSKLILTTRQDFPDKSSWQSIVQQDASSFNDLLAELTQTEANLIADLAIPGLDSFPELQNQLEQLCSLHLLNFFQQSGISIDDGRLWTVKEVGRNLKLISKFEKFLGLLLDILNRDELIRWQGQQFTFTSTSGTNWAQQISLLEQKINQDYPGFTALHEMVAYCVAHFNQALSGEIEAISVLYPDGDRNLIAETGEKTVEHSNHRVYYLLLKHLVLQTLEKSNKAQSEDVFRILEVGGGSGVLTGIIAPSLKGKKVEYYFTDIGKSFVLKVKQQAQQQGLDFMHFAVFDIFKDPVEQGFDLQSFDLIYGLDVVHATPDIRFAISQLSRLLKPGADLCLVETPPIPRWYEMVWGLAEGWWYFNDTELRSGTTPLLTPDKWQQVMSASDLFVQVTVFPQDPEQRSNADCCLVIARVPGKKQTSNLNSYTRNRQQLETINRLLDMQRAGSEIMVCTADVCNQSNMNNVVDRAINEYGAIDGIFHTAASDSRGYIEQQDKARSELEIQPKVLGTQVLQGSIDFKKLDFVLLFSSLNAMTGGQGNIAYTAANSYLDAFAHYCRHHHLGHVYTLDWDRWQSIGQAVAFEQRALQRTGTDLKGGISNAEGFEAIRRALSSGYSQLLVKTGRTQETMQAAAVASAAVTSRAVQEKKSSVHQRPNLVQSYVAPETDMQQMIAEVWAEVLGIEQLGIDDEFFTLGGDSLIAIRVMSRLKELLSMNLEVKLIFEYNTIAQLASYIQAVQATLLLNNMNDDQDTEYEGGVI